MEGPIPDPSTLDEGEEDVVCLIDFIMHKKALTLCRLPLRYKNKPKQLHHHALRPLQVKLHHLLAIAKQ